MASSGGFCVASVEVGTYVVVVSVGVLWWYMVVVSGQSMKCGNGVFSKQQRQRNNKGSVMIRQETKRLRRKDKNQGHEQPNKATP